MTDLSSNKYGIFRLGGDILFEQNCITVLSPRRAEEQHLLTLQKSWDGNRKKLWNRIIETIEVATENKQQYCSAMTIVEHLQNPDFFHLLENFGYKLQIDDEVVRIGWSRF